LSSADELLDSAVIIAFISFLESIAIAKAFARKNGYLREVRPNQELMALGMANMLSSFFHSYPITGSFSRTSVNNRAGVKTPLAGLVTAVIVVTALLLLTPAFFYIPNAALAAVIICAVLKMFEYKIVAELWSLGPIGYLDLLCFCVSFFGCLLVNIHDGMLAAIGLSLAIMLYRQARPPMLRMQQVRVAGAARPIYVSEDVAPSISKSATMQQQQQQTVVSSNDGDNNAVMSVKQLQHHADVLVLKLQGPLMFASTNHFVESVEQRLDGEQQQQVRALVFECSAMTYVDSTGVMALVDLVQRLQVQRDDADDAILIRLCSVNASVAGALRNVHNVHFVACDATATDEHFAATASLNDDSHHHQHQGDSKQQSLLSSSSSSSSSHGTAAAAAYPTVQLFYTIESAVSAVRAEINVRFG
jgi:MFS superfamily sulfate permease-like transporter